MTGSELFELGWVFQLELIQETGSIAAAARTKVMAYCQVWSRVAIMSHLAGVELGSPTFGGRKGGGPG
jgi:molybdate transport repressor ModE-like protein